MRSRSMLFLLLTVILALMPTATWSQAISGDIVGTVTDPSGAVVSSTTVTALNTATNFKTTTVADANGAYHFVNLPIGRYNVSTTAAGYAVSTVQAQVELNKTKTVPLVLRVGKVETVVQVTDEAATVDTTSAQISNSFDGKLATELPEASTGSGVLNLALLAPGVTSGSAMGYGTGPSVGGQRPTNNSFMLEGVDNNYKGTTGPVTSVPADAVAEFTMLQNQFSPEFGHSSGGQFNTVVKSGSNAFHGRAYEYFQNKDLNALDPAKKSQQDFDKPRLDNNRFGGSFSGPIIKNKLFFFGLAEYNPVGAAASSSAEIYVPTGDSFHTLDGLASQNLISSTNLNVFKQYTQNLATTPTNISTPISGRGIPVGTTIQLAAVSVDAPAWQNTLNTVGSIDYNISDKDQLRGRWIYNRQNMIDPNGASLSSFFSTDAFRAHTIAITEFHTFSPNLSNEFRVGYNRLVQDYPIGNYSFPGLSNFPTLTFDDLNSLQVGPNGNYPQGNWQNSYSMSDSVSWNKGRHSLKFGGDVMRVIAPSNFVQYLRPEYEYKTLGMYLQDLSPDSVATRGFTSGGLYYGNNYSVSGYANDTFKATKNLTLNLGLRYEFSTLPQGAALQTLNSMNNVPGLITFGQPQVPTKNFMPRVGFAYSPGASANTSIRGGFGLNYDIVFDNLFQNAMPQEFQYTTSIDLNAQTPAFLKNGGITAGTGPNTSKSKTAELIPTTVKDPYTENWNLGVQHVFKNIWTVDAEYVGSHTIHLPMQEQINIFSPVSATSYLPTYFAPPTQAQLNALPLTLAMLQAQGHVLSAYQSAGFTNPITSETPFGMSTYNAFDLSVKRNFTNNLQMQASWTWSHNISNSDAMVNSTALNPRRPQDFLNPAAEKSNSLLNRTHRIVVSAVYEEPFFKHSNAILKNVAGGWQIVPTYTFESPQYVTVQSGTDSNLNGDSAADRAIYNAVGISGMGADAQALYNSAGAVVAYQAGTWNAAHTVFTPCASASACPEYVVAGKGALSNLGRNTLPLPRTDNINLSVSKTVRVNERMNFQFTAQAFNLFNHAQYIAGNLYDAGLNNNLTSLRAFVMPTGTPGSSFNNPSQVFSGNPRTMVLVLKFNF